MDFPGAGNDLFLFLTAGFLSCHLLYFYFAIHMKFGKKTKELLRLNIIRIGLLLVTFVYMLPFLWMITTSLKADQDLFLFPPKWIPIPPVWSNYKKAVEYFPFFRYFMNSVIITAGSVVGAILSCPLVAYSFSKIKWPGRDFFFYLMLSTMMLPFAVTMIPTFIIFKKLHLVNTLWPLIIPSFLEVLCTFS